MISKRALILHAIESARATIRRVSQRADEALGASPAASITRKGARRVVQATVSDFGARDASRSIARLSDEGEPVKLDAFRDDVERKKSLAQVMPARKNEAGLLDEIFGGLLDDHDCDDSDKDAEGRCPDDPDFDPDTAGQYEATDEAERDPRRPMKRFGMDPDWATLAYANEMRASRGAERLAAKEEANYRLGSGSERCGSCRFFESPAGCSKVAGLIRPIDVCDLFEPRSSRAQSAIDTFRSEMNK